jgi:hypothetical protein
VLLLALLQEPPLARAQEPPLARAQEPPLARAQERLRQLAALPVSVPKN